MGYHASLKIYVIKHEQIRNAGQLEKCNQNKKSSSFKRYKQLFNKPLHRGVFLMKQKINHRFCRWFFHGYIPRITYAPKCVCNKACYTSLKSTAFHPLSQTSRSLQGLQVEYQPAFYPCTSSSRQQVQG